MSEIQSKTDWEKAFCVLSKKMYDLRLENAELKKQLNKKDAPPKGTIVRDKKDGQIAYSCGFLCGTALAVVPHLKDEEQIVFIDWEEIEIKVK